MTATVISKKFIKESHAVMSSSFIIELWLKERVQEIVTTTEYPHSWILYWVIRRLWIGWRIYYRSYFHIKFLVVRKRIRNLLSSGSKYYYKLLSNLTTIAKSSHYKYELKLSLILFNAAIQWSSYKMCLRFLYINIFLFCWILCYNNVLDENNNSTAT